LRHAAQLQDQQADLHQQATAVATANSGKNGPFLFRMPGIFSPSLRSATQRHLTALARRDKEID
jgi:hypothetical protein